METFLRVAPNLENLSRPEGVGMPRFGNAAKPIKLPRGSPKPRFPLDTFARVHTEVFRVIEYDTFVRWRMQQDEEYARAKRLLARSNLDMLARSV